MLCVYAIDKTAIVNMKTYSFEEPTMCLQNALFCGDYMHRSATDNDFVSCCHGILLPWYNSNRASCCVQTRRRSKRERPQSAKFFSSSTFPFQRFSAPFAIKRMSAIAAIDKQTVHRICSGQVVLDLATAVKELVENSLDAGASSIEIKFKENGLEGIEVIDNGYGIAPENYEHLALKHYTSKIQRFEDLESVRTFGFRGEALSSLCSLCEVVVATATKEQAPRGVKLVYDAEGHLVSQSPFARAMGTTVQLSKIFHALPVRQQEFQRNIKREYGKALAIIQAYGIIAKNTKIIATSQPARGNNTRAIATSGNKAVRENISNVFGVKVLSQITHFQVDLAPVLSRVGRRADEEDSNGALSESQPAIHGFISKPDFGHGRGSGDRQYFFINGRPCTLPKLARAFNELYRSFVSNQYPFIVADILLSPDMYDVNVTPDKRTILLHNEQPIIEYFIDELREQLEPSRSTFVAEPLVLSNLRQGDSDPSTTASSNVLSELRHQEDPNSLIPEATTPTPTPSPSFTTTTTSGASSYPITSMSSSRVKNAPQPAPTRMSLASFTYSNQRTSYTAGSSRKRPNSSITDFLSKRPRPQQGPVDDVLEELSRKSVESENDELADDEDGDDTPKTTATTTNSTAIDDQQPLTIHFEDGQQQEEDEDDGEEPMDLFQDNDAMILSTPGPWYTRGTTRSASIRPEMLQSSVYCRQRLRRFSNKTNRSISQDIGDSNNSTPTTVVLESADLTNTDDHEIAAAALNRVIKKTDFAKMKVIGQFNLGFIITMLDGHDLFIVDQHASDEKYNFETLQSTTIIDGQRLIMPKNPELTPFEEQVAMANEDILRANGFELEIDPSKESTQRIRILSHPTSKNVEFTDKDFSELVHALSERPGQMVRCSRVRAMFASRACRSSVMIGHCLNMRKMSQIVQHMGEIDQPWNCPHGRPTMRHLCSIANASTKGIMPRKPERAIGCKGSLFR
ncbi:hypothetical protein BDB00DRAFT_30829 [Zychaea mexicana]|uniref:uncharacterized protein n=1 Tax=Zychaea mexicana TaxID=64656 RepID=UPI0022FE96F3|nr:uncharacterized protein BDB00DRAFT_30829 [Zychaea mexicana]KAI9488678.1 hypothetical protein BDB00DRAFT_30829 [Zychaea mexicana]